MRRIPATIVTGFLGAGKTSLVRHLLATPTGHRLAIIVNEFGELGIDRELLLGCGDATCTDDDIVELANGCICCTVADDFLPTMTRLLERADAARPYRHRDLGPRVAEAAGAGLRLAGDPHPHHGRRRDRGGRRRGASAAGRFADDPEARCAAARRRSGARPRQPARGGVHRPARLRRPRHPQQDRPARRRRARRAARARSRRGCGRASSWSRAAQGGCRPAVALGLAAAAEDDLAARPSLHELEGEHDHDDFESFVVDRGPVAEPRSPSRAGLPRRSARTTCCGSRASSTCPAATGARSCRRSATASQQHFDRAWRAGEARATRLVVIGRKGLDRAAIAAALAVTAAA